MDRMKSAKDFVRQRWLDHVPVALDNSTGWHTCTCEKCNIHHLNAQVCMHGEAHAHDPKGACAAHSGSAVLHVETLYGCWSTGAVHECEVGKCVVVDGKCTISGRPVMVQDEPVAPATAPSTNRRGRRRRAAPHTNDQLACILIYDLLFSKRRKAYEAQRTVTCNDLSRRQVQRMCRDAIKSHKPFYLHLAVDTYIQNRERYRLQPAYLNEGNLDPQDTCRKYANVSTRVWNAFSDVLSKRITFDAMCAALLYHMRRGIAYGGIYIIPQDSFLFNTLPGT